MYLANLYYKDFIVLLLSIYTIFISYESLIWILKNSGVCSYVYLSLANFVTETNYARVK